MRKMNKKKMVMVTTLMLLLINNSIAFADGSEVNATIDTILQPFDILKALGIAVISSVGVFFILKNGYNFALALQQQDGPSMGNAGLGLASGFIMVSIGVLLAIMGF